MKTELKIKIHLSGGIRISCRKIFIKFVCQNERIGTLDPLLYLIQSIATDYCICLRKHQRGPQMKCNLFDAIFRHKMNFFFLQYKKYNIPILTATDSRKCRSGNLKFQLKVVNRGGERARICKSIFFQGGGTFVVSHNHNQIHNGKLGF